MKKIIVFTNIVKLLWSLYVKLQLCFCCLIGLWPCYCGWKSMKFISRSSASTEVCRPASRPWTRSEPSTASRRFLTTAQCATSSGQIPRTRKAGGSALEALGKVSGSSFYVGSQKLLMWLNFVFHFCFCRFLNVNTRRVYVWLKTRLIPNI